MIYENTFFFDLYPCALTHTFFTRVDLLLTNHITSENLQYKIISQFKTRQQNYSYVLT